MSANPLVPAVSVAIRRGNRLLLVRRGRAPSAGLYAFPGGRVEPGETDEEAVRRELAEETGLAGCDFAFLREFLLEPATTGASGFRLRVFSGRCDDGEPVAMDDAESAGWFTLEEMRRQPIIASVLEMAEDILAS
ncbi:MAG: NUDIX hydrolase [Rhizobiaceae bacterium]